MICPVCGCFKHVLPKQVFLNGYVSDVCNGCFHEAFLKTNLPRMFHAPKKRFFEDL